MLARRARGNAMNLLIRPKAPPTVRAKFRSPVHTARSSSLELASRPIKVGCSVKPTPAPSMRRMPTMVPMCVVRPNMHLRPVPTVHSPKPVMTRGIYRPTLARNWPLMTENMDVVTIRGKIIAPDCSAENPRTDWKYMLKMVSASWTYLELDWEILLTALCSS